MKLFEGKGYSPSVPSRMRRVFRVFGEFGVQTLDQLDDDAVQRYERSILEGGAPECRLRCSGT